MPPEPLVPALPPTPPTTPPPALPPVDLPATARLHYEVIGIDGRTDPPRQSYGKGVVNWQTSADGYRLDLTASVSLLFLSIEILNSHSEGRLGPDGLAPTRYTETPRSRATVAANFNRDPASPLANTITFSATGNSYPLVATAQDRLSVIFQMAGLLRANPAVAVAGRRMAVFVAGPRDAETWNFEVLGHESLRLADQDVDTLRLRRLARPNSNDRTVDLWYAPSRGGVPAQIRYTDANGNRIDLILQGTE